VCVREKEKWGMKRGIGRERGRREKMEGERERERFTEHNETKVHELP
jgi:hypothetical protein